MTDLLQTFAISLGLGLLVGLQRERADSRLAGFRTFPLVTMLGTLCGALARDQGGWVVAAAFVALAAVVVSGNYARIRGGATDPGLTTEVALLLMFGVGAYLPDGSRTLAIVLGAVVAVLLHLKPQLHGLASRLGEHDFRAIMQFVMISLVILPVLPDRAYGPFAVLNPHRIWWMVVLITGISLGGYLIYRFFGQRAGIAAGGVLGGLISSTATTVSYARRSKAAPGSANLAAAVIMLASAIVFARVLALIGVVGRTHFTELAPPLAVMLAVMLVIAFGFWWKVRREPAELPPQGNPTELKSALVFTVLYAVVLLAVAAAKEQFGDRGLYVVAVLSGLTDMDAITLSTAQLVSEGGLAPPTGWRVILMASLSNLVFKAGTVAVLGGPALFRRIALLFAGALVAGIMILLTG